MSRLILGFTSVFVVVFLTCFEHGCAPREELFTEYDVLPELLEYTSVSFPPEAIGTRRTEELRVKIHITTNGIVDRVEPISTTGNPRFVQTAVDAIKHWRFTPALYKNKPVPVWIVQTFVFRIEEIPLYTLREIVVQRKSLADSLLTMLRAGVPFDSLAQRYSNSASASIGGWIGKVRLDRFPPPIREIIRKLKPTEFTEPLEISGGWAIYFRVE
ncbi:MAG: TonB family protein [Bacteroidota bacterium]